MIPLGLGAAASFWTGVAISAASTVISLNLKTVYQEATQYYHTSTYGLAKNEYKIFKHSNYSTIISSGSSQFYYAWQ